MSERKILIVDGNNAAWRLIKRLPPLSVKGQDIQLVYGFVRLLRGVIQQFEPNVAIVAWDSGHSEFRKKTFKHYKGNRNHDGDEEHKKEFESFVKQVGILNEILSKLNVATLNWPGTEADDLIGLACSEIQGRKIIVSADMDMLQLVKHDVEVWSPMKLEGYTERNFKSKSEGLNPRQYLEVKALIGDKSDNIPGVASGFGQATATELIKRYGSIENLFTTKVEKTVYNKGNRYKLLYSEGAREIAYRNLILMDLSVCGHAVKDKSEAVKTMKQLVRFRHKIDSPEVKRIFIERMFKSLLEDFGSWIKPFESLDWMEQE